MDNPDKNGQPRQEWTTQTRMNNPNKNGQHRQEWTTQTGMDNTDKNGQPRHIDNIEHKGQKTRTNKAKHNLTQKTKTMSNMDPTKDLW
jgi:hypothetical protein